MNAANLRRVADAIEHHSIPYLGFNMLDFRNHHEDRSGNNCRTSACIGGWAVELLGTEKQLDKIRYGRSSYWIVATRILNLSKKQAQDLFGGSVSGTFFTETTPAQAVRTLRYAADHDVIDWDAANPAEAR